MALQSEMAWASQSIAPTLVIALAGITLCFIIKLIGLREPQQLVKSIPSPRLTLLPRLSEAQASALPYPPNLFPGSRDVDSPYGSMRVYEWGPENGNKVLMIPGDTSPAPVFGHISRALVNQSFRVMIFDTWGRGYSDSPQNVQHDANLFVMQVFLAIMSSPLSWTGSSSNGFAVIGFSLGGSVAMSFASHFPYLINSIVLLAPGGLIKELPEGYTSTLFRYRRYVPSRLLRDLVAKILGTTLSPSPLPLENATPVSVDNLDLPSLWQWQFDHHKGFIHSFVDTTQHGPLMHQHEDWTRACSHIAGNGLRPSNVSMPSKLSKSKFLIICGLEDTVVVKEEVQEQVSAMLPADRLVFRTVPGTHSFPAFSSADVMKHILDFWGLQEPR